jgi:D-aspartate ligase
LNGNSSYGRLFDNVGSKRVRTYLMKMDRAKASRVQKERSTTLTYQREQVGVVVIGGHFQGLGLLRSLGSRNVPTYLLDRGTCIARFSRYTNRFSKCPDVREESLFLEFLMDLAKKENIEGWIIYPNDDETVYFLAKYREQLEEYYRITTPPWDTVKFAYDKRLTYELAEKCNIATPETFCPSKVEELKQLDIKFPVILKPSVKEPFFSKTRKKAIQVNDRKQLIDGYNKAARVVNGWQIMVQDRIPGGARNLFSVGSLCRNGDLLAKVVVRRTRQHPMDFGHATTFAETVDIPELEEFTRKILAAMGYYGLSEVEFMLDPRDGKYKLLEINARIWGWHSIGIGAGVDLPYLSYLDMLGEKVKQNDFAIGVKWFRLATDIPTAVIELLSGRMRFTEYLHSLKGRKQFAVMSAKDPLPFIVELAMLPYLWMKRGF